MMQIQLTGIKFLVILLVALWSALASGQGSQIYFYGNKKDVSPSIPLLGGAVLSGGTEDVSYGFDWMYKQGGQDGDWVILSASETDSGYPKYLFDKFKINSVAGIHIWNRAASEQPDILTKIRNAEAIFIDGGDQLKYKNFWSGTALQVEVNAAIQRGVPIGGISAGLAIAGEFAFTADYGGITSEDALSNPMSETLVFSRGLLNIPSLKNIIVDSHFTQRSRLGRLIAFMTRLTEGFRLQVPAKGVGVDQETVFLLQTKGEAIGTGTVVGRGEVVFVTQTADTKYVLKPSSPLQISDLEVTRLSSGSGFDLNKWRPCSGSAMLGKADVVDGRLIYR